MVTKHVTKFYFARKQTINFAGVSDQKDVCEIEHVGCGAFSPDKVSWFHTFPQVLTFSW